MKKHLMLAVGVLLSVVFGVRTALALLEPGIGGKELYLIGGLLLSGWLIFAAMAEWRFHFKNNS